MSETTGTPTGSASQTPGTEAQVPRQVSREAPVEPTGWVGWIAFAGVVMIVMGAFHAIQGLVALFKQEYFVIGENGLLVSTSYDAWGWTHLIVGIIVVLAGFALLSGQTWARVLAVVLAVVSALANIAFIGAYPFWSLIMIALDVLIVYAVTVHGREMKAL